MPASDSALGLLILFAHQVVIFLAFDMMSFDCALDILVIMIGYSWSHFNLLFSKSVALFRFSSEVLLTVVLSGFSDRSVFSMNTVLVWSARHLVLLGFQRTLRS